MKVHSALIIDDEMDICLLLNNYLAKKNIKVSYSNTLNEGFLKYKDSFPDLLILDHNLPDGNGINSIMSFKKDNDSLQVIVISAMSNLRTTALKSGADFFLEKPISFSELNKLIT